MGSTLQRISGERPLPEAFFADPCDRVIDIGLLHFADGRRGEMTPYRTRSSDSTYSPCPPAKKQLTTIV